MSTNVNSPTTVRATEAVLGGIILGLSSGMYMLVTGKVAGNSGAVKACVLSIAQKAGNDFSRYSNILFFVGLLLAGALTSFLTPWGFEPYPFIEDDWYTYIFGGMLVGSGTYFANGCTSGHGLSGISKFSLRSFLATPIFMFFAALTAMTRSLFSVGPIAPFVETPSPRSEMIGFIVLALFVLFLPLLYMKSKDKMYEKAVLLYAGLWCGLTFGVGLAVGGMVRPSAVRGALSMKRFDFTLWILFTVGLITTFINYRIAEKVFHIKQARSQKQGPYDKKLIGGSVLFGIGWGLTGVCPGPLLVGVFADFNSMATQRITGGPLLMLFFVFIGTSIARIMDKLCCKMNSATVGSNDQNVDVTTLAKLITEDNALVLDVRNADQRETDSNGVYVVFENTLSAPLDRSDPNNFTLPTKMLPEDKNKPIVIHCKGGTRARMAMNKVSALSGYTRLHCCGLSEMKELSVKSPETNIVYHENKLKTHNGTGIFLQFFDNIGGSSTFTYLIGDTETKECILIDPVLECMDRDLQKIQELGLTLVYGINTHCHADHITSTGKMKTKTTTMKSVISETSGAVADLKINDGDDIKWANGKRTLKCISTPGHTNGCMSYFDADIGSVFTGDTLLIDGCGRTDFQEGSSENLYNSVHNKLFTLPSSTIVYPGHDYKGRVRSTIGHEKKYNSRLTLPLNEYVELMKNLGLSYPKKIDVAVPANMICGV